MELIIDANILMSALISTEGKTFDLILNDKIRLFAPDYLFLEIKKYENLILEKSGLSESDFKLFLALVSSRIEAISQEGLKEYKKQSKKISPDINDYPYFALSLKLKIPIWTNDKKLKEQKIIKILNTQEIIKLLFD